MEESFFKRAKASLSTSSRFSGAVFLNGTILDLLEEEYGISKEWVEIDEFDRIHITLPKWYEQSNLLKTIQNRIPVPLDIDLEYE